MAWSEGSFKEVLSNNADYYTQIYITSWGPTTVLLAIGLILAFMTFLKTGAYFLSSASIIPIRTGVVRDIRNQLYEKITSLISTRLTRRCYHLNRMSAYDPRLT